MILENNNKTDIVVDYLFEIDKPFTLDDLFKSTGLKKTKEDKEEIHQFLRTIDDFVEDKEQFYPKMMFLKNIPIRVQPTEFEIKRGILIPGHRLLPFHPPGLMPDDISFTFAGEPVKTKNTKLKMLELLVYFKLMDLQKVPISNIEDILEENAGLKIQVYRLDKFYKTHKFKPGDTIILRPVDFKEGIFSVEYDSFANYQNHIFEIQKLDRLFLTTLKKVLEQELFFPNVERQLLYTYYYLTKPHQFAWKWNWPGTALDHLLGESKEITFSPLTNGRTVFHFVHQSVEDLEIYPDFDDLLAEADEKEFDLATIDGILGFLNNNNNITTVRALLFDRVSSGKDFNYQEIEDYLFDGLDQPYMPAEFRIRLKDLLEEEYSQIKESFDLKYAYLPISTARKKILDQALEISRFLRSLDAHMIELDQLPQKEMLQLMEVDRSFNDVLHQLEALQMQGTQEVSEIHRIIKIIDRTARELPALFETIREKLELSF